ncbi:hypothetical protein EDC01DRAFT_634180 [Geopyxis carbonaria]|nr:hypothetical protein EDC01DRAFT_634180 [Geopyxis carbonaria]
MLPSNRQGRPFRQPGSEIPKTKPDSVSQGTAFMSKAAIRPLLRPSRSLFSLGTVPNNAADRADVRANRQGFQDRNLFALRTMQPNPEAYSTRNLNAANDVKRNIRSKYGILPPSPTKPPSSLRRQQSIIDNLPTTTQHRLRVVQSTQNIRGRHQPVIPANKRRSSASPRKVGKADKKGIIEHIPRRGQPIRPTSPKDQSSRPTQRFHYDLNGRRVRVPAVVVSEESNLNNDVSGNVETTSSSSEIKIKGLTLEPYISLRETTIDARRDLELDVHDFLDECSDEVDYILGPTRKYIPSTSAPIHARHFLHTRTNYTSPTESSSLKANRAINSPIKK